MIILPGVCSSSMRYSICWRVYLFGDGGRTGNVTTLPLQDMTLQKKLSVMELLCVGLACSPESVESPGWHEYIFEERRERVVEGNAHL